MKTITLKEAHDLLQDASAVIINGSFLGYPSIWDLHNNDENEFLYFSLDEGNIKFREGDNKIVKICGSSMFLYDIYADGEEDHTQITILTTKELE